MKTLFLLFFIVNFFAANFLFAQVPVDQDTIFIPGGTLHGAENAGLLETTINGDTVVSGANSGQRVNPNRVYALERGKVYYQNSAIWVNNPAGKLTIVGYGNKSLPMPIILIQQRNVPIIIEYEGSNVVYGSIKIESIHWQTMALDGYLRNELFYCGTKDKLPQSLTIDNCLFEFCNIDLFDCTDEQGAIGGWPYGAKFRITNSYFRNMFNVGQWWGSRIFQCKHPIDTLWIENCTITSSGLTFLNQNSLTKFLYINHNTFVNTHKYWLLSPYYIEYYVTNNMFINHNWTGEDINVISPGMDPDKYWTSTILIDTINTLYNEYINVQPEFREAGNYTNAVAPKNMKVYVSNNINYNDPLMDTYYKNTSGLYGSETYPQSYLTWGGLTPPFQIQNIPGQWMNDQTVSLFDKFSPAKGGKFIEEHTISDNPNTVTPGIANAEVAAQMAAWNQNQYGDPSFPSSANDILHTAYINGDYEPTTIPGVKTDDGSGIVKFSDLTENYSQSSHLSALDGLPIGSVIWNDAIAFNSAANFQKVMASYAKLVSDVKVVNAGIPDVYTLSQNYPNPFNPTTTINFSIPKAGTAKLVVYNMLGQQVRTLVNEVVNAGNMSATWDGKDSHGVSVSSGIYFYQLTAGAFTATHKMILMK
jgi:hypothetical protein